MGFGVAGRAACQWRRAVTNQAIAGSFHLGGLGHGRIRAYGGKCCGARRGGREPAEANGYRSGVLGLVSKGDLQEKGHD
jgi:hypothetical protein